METKPSAEVSAANATPRKDNTATTPAPEQQVSHYDREGYDEAESPKLSHEVIEFDRQIPLIAEPGSDRRNHVPKHIMDEVHQFLDDFQRPEESAPPPRDRTDPDQPATERRTRPSTQVDTTVNARTSDNRRSSYLDLDDARDAREPETDRVAGPSFLGLGNSDYEYVYDDQPASHWRRNFALLVLVVLAGLAAVQWRSIRDMGLEYAKSGTIQVHVPKRGDQGQNAGTTQPANGANSNGAPNMSVDPTRNADEENARLRAEEEAAKNQQQQQQTNAQQPNNSTNNNASTTAPPAIPPADTATTDNVNNTRTSSNNSPATVPPSTAPANAQPAARNANSAPAMSAAAGSANNMPAAEEAAPTPARSVAAPAPKKRSARLSNPEPSPAAPGAFEMQQANILGQTPSAVPWLWSALGKGNPDAPVKLADMYLTGHGVEKSCDQGLVILRSAAARGNARASARLGTLYATGICVQQNRVQAYEWMGTAAGRSASLSSWAEAYRQTLWQQMTPEERARVR